MEKNNKPLLTLKDVSVRYGPQEILHEISLIVNEGEIAIVIGPNGAGKTTLLHTISGLLHPYNNSEIKFRDQSIQYLPPEKIARLGIAHVPEGRRLFTDQSVKDNLMLGAYQVKNKAEIVQTMKLVFNQFPILEKRQYQVAASLSGGEQQMLAIARSLMSRPTLLMLDEPSLGLSPALANEIFKMCTELKRQNITILLVEQLARKALQIADRGYLLEKGRIVAEGTSSELTQNERVKEAYLGMVKRK